MTNNIDLACSNSTNWIQPYRKQADPNQTLGLLSVSTQSLCQVCCGGPEKADPISEADPLLLKGDQIWNKQEA